MRSALQCLESRFLKLRVSREGSQALFPARGVRSSAAPIASQATGSLLVRHRFACPTQPSIGVLAQVPCQLLPVFLRSKEGALCGVRVPLPSSLGRLFAPKGASASPGSRFLASREGASSARDAFFTRHAERPPPRTPSRRHGACWSGSGVRFLGRRRPLQAQGASSRGPEVSFRAEGVASSAPRVLLLEAASGSRAKRVPLLKNLARLKKYTPFWESGRVA
jgi:hypothetical protein